MSPERERLAATLAGELAAVAGVAAVVLGGSCARGLERPDSDLDLGVYYTDALPLDVPALRRVARRFHAGDDPVVTELHAWGPWVNGGAWLTLGAQRVDVLYRSIERVRQTIDEARRGVTRHDFAQQPPYGFFSVIYLGEVACCRPLVDVDGVVAALKEEVRVYPPALRARLVQDGLWLVDFTLRNAQGMAARADGYGTVGCLTRCAAYLTQVLFARDGTYFVSDKTALREIESFAARPREFPARLSRILAAPGATADELRASVDAMTALFQETVAICGDGYHPQY